MKKVIRFLVVIIVLGGVLAIFRPDESSFKNYIQKRYESKREAAKGESALNRILEKGVNTFTELQIIATFEYENKYVFAWVQAEVGETKFAYIGVLGNWIALPANKK